MIDQVNTDLPPILVEFTPRPGLQQTGILGLSHAELAEKSSAALDSAMTVMRHMTQRFSESIQTLRQQKFGETPSEIEIEFGIKLDAEVGALLSKAGMEAAVTVKLIWKQSLDETT